MSAISSRTMSQQRPASLVAAVVITAISTLIALATIPLFVGDSGSVVATGIVGAVLGLIAAFGAWGLWQGRRWGGVVVFVITAVNGLLSVPGVPFADKEWGSACCPPSASSKRSSSAGCSSSAPRAPPSVDAGWTCLRPLLMLCAHIPEFRLEE